jgi:hypothetical protein
VDFRPAGLRTHEDVRRDSSIERLVEESGGNTDEWIPLFDHREWRAAAVAEMAVHTFGLSVHANTRLAGDVSEMLPRNDGDGSERGAVRASAFGAMAVAELDDLARNLECDFAAQASAANHRDLRRVSDIPRSLAM